MAASETTSEVEIVEGSSEALGQKREVLGSSVDVDAASVDAGQTRRVQLISSLGLRLSAVNLRGEDGAEVRQEVRSVGDTGMEFDVPSLGVTEVGALGHAWVPLPKGPEPTVTLEPLASVVLTGFAATPASLKVQWGVWPPDEQGQFGRLGWSQRLEADRHAIALDPERMPPHWDFHLDLVGDDGRGASVSFDMAVRSYWELSVAYLLGDAPSTPLTGGLVRILGAPAHLDVVSALWSLRVQPEHVDTLGLAPESWPPGLRVTRYPAVAPAQTEGGLSGSGGDVQLRYRAPPGALVLLQFLDPTTGAWVGQRWSHSGEGHVEPAYAWPKLSVRFGASAVALTAGGAIEVRVAERVALLVSESGKKEAQERHLCSAQFDPKHLRSMDSAVAAMPLALSQISTIPIASASTPPSPSRLVAVASFGVAATISSSPSTEDYVFEFDASMEDFLRMPLDSAPELLEHAHRLLGEELELEGPDASGGITVGRGVLERDGEGLVLRWFSEYHGADPRSKVDLEHRSIASPGDGAVVEFRSFEDLPVKLALGAGPELPMLLVDRRGPRLELQHAVARERRAVPEPDPNQPGERTMGLWRLRGWAGVAGGPSWDRAPKIWFHWVPAGALLEVHEGLGAGGEVGAVRSYPASR